MHNGGAGDKSAEMEAEQRVGLKVGGGGVVTRRVVGKEKDLEGKTSSGRRVGLYLLAPS